MTQPKAILIYNPMAGPLDRLHMMREVANWWQARGWQVVVQPTQWAGHTETLARRAAEDGLQMVLAAGGDGTINEVVNGIAGTHTVLALLPSGTGNSMAKELRMPRPTILRSEQLLESAETLYQGRVQQVDLMYLQRGRYALQWVGAGAAAFIVNQLEPRTKLAKRIGVAGYFSQGVFELSRMPNWKNYINVDGKVFEGNYRVISISNSRNFMGGEIVLHPNAQWDDGIMEVLLVETKTKMGVLQVLAQARLGQHLHNNNVKLLSGRHVVIRTVPMMPIHIDGEVGGKTPITCEIRPKALRVLVPNTAPTDLFKEEGVSLAEAFS